MSDELKLYVRRHSLSELSESVKELFESYKISENFDQLQQVSETCSQLPVEGNQSSDNDDVKSSSSSITEVEKTKPKPLDKNVDGEPHGLKATKRTQKKDDSEKTRRSAPESVTNSKTSTEFRGRSIQRKSRKPSKQASAQDSEDKVKKQGKKPAACAEGDSFRTTIFSSSEVIPFYFTFMMGNWSLMQVL